MTPSQKEKKHARDILLRMRKGESLGSILSDAPGSFKDKVGKIIPRFEKKFTWFSSSEVRSFFTKSFLSFVIVLLVGMALYSSFTHKLSLFSFSKNTVVFAAEAESSSFPVDGTFTFTFSGNVNTEKVQKAFKIEPAVEGDFSWSASKSELVFSPKQLLAAKTTYTVSFSAGFVEGNSMWKVTTRERFGVASVSPSDGSFVVPVSAPVRVKFNYSTVVTDAFPQHFSISPSVNGTFVYDGFYANFIPASSLQKETEYKVTLTKGLQTGAGEALSDDFSWTFVTAGDRAQDYPVLNGQKLVSESYYNADHLFSFYYSDLTSPLEFTFSRSSIDAVLQEQGTDSSSSEQSVGTVVPSIQTIQQWSEQPKSGKNVEHFAQFPVKEPGVFLLTVVSGGKTLIRTEVVVTKLAMMQFVDGAQQSFWLADIQSSKAVGAAVVKGYSLKNGAVVLSSQSSDDKGLVTFTKQNSALYVAEKDGSYAVLSAGDPSASLYSVFCSLSQGVYQPNQTLQFQAVVRKTIADRYAKVPEKTSVLVTIVGKKQGTGVLSKELIVDASSSVVGSFSLSTLPVGEYSISMYFGEAVVPSVASFTVGDPQAFSLQVIADKREYSSKDKASVAIESSSKDGQVLADKELNYTVTVADFTLPEFLQYSDDFTYLHNASQPLSSSVFAEGKVKLGPDGKGILNFSTDLKDALQNKVLSIQLWLDEQGKQVVRGGDHIVVYRGDAALGYQDEQKNFLQVGTPFDVLLKTEDHRRQVLPNINTKATVFRKWWDKKKVRDIPIPNSSESHEIYTYAEQSEQVEFKARQTDAAGKFSFQITLSKPGNYALVAKADDVSGNSITLQDSLICVDDQSPSWAGKNSFQVVGDKKFYSPGETAKIAVLSPRNDGFVLLSIEQDGVTQQLVELKNFLTMVDLPITQQSAGVVRVHAFLVSNDQVLTSSFSVPVRSSSHALAVHVDLPQQDQFFPGQELKASISTTTFDGQAQSAVLSVNLVAASSFGATGDFSGDIFSSFYGVAERSGVFNNSLQVATVDQLSMRGAFPTAIGSSVFWKDTIKTDEKGKAEVSLRLPDALNRWLLVVRAVSVDEIYPRIGSSYRLLPVEKNVAFEPMVPLFVTSEDEVIIKGTLQNFSGAADTFDVAMDPSSLTLNTDAKVTVQLDNGKSKEVSWKVKANAVSEIRVALQVHGQTSGISKSYEQKLPVYPTGFTHVSSKGGDVSYPSTQVQFDTEKGATAFLHLYPSILAYCYETMQYLGVHATTSHEEVVSNFLPIALVYKQYDALGVQDSLWKDYLQQALESNLHKISAAQNSDGGWGWFPGQASDPELTVYTAFALSKAKAKQQEISDAMVTKALSYLQALSSNATISSDTKLFALYVLALEGKDVTSSLQTFDGVQQLSDGALAFQGLGLVESKQQDKAKEVFAHLQQLAIYKDNMMFWEGNPGSGQQMFAGSSFANAMALQLALQTGASKDIKEKIVRWMLSSKSGYLWDTSLSSSLVMTSLVEYVLQDKVQSSDMGYSVKVNGNEIASEKVQGNYHLPVFVDVEKGTGTGTIGLDISRTYGSGTLRYLLDQQKTTYDNTQADDTSIGVQKTYLNDAGSSVQRVSVGDVVHVQLKVNLSKEMTYLRVVDFMPAGFEPIVTDEENEQSYKEKGFVWPNFKKTLSNRVEFYKGYLPAGTHTFAYLLRAKVPGSFVANPPRAEHLYLSSLRGVGEVRRIEVE
ncbi:MAG: Ig-like domain-containing protein [bacterium]